MKQVKEKKKKTFKIPQFVFTLDELGGSPSRELLGGKGAGLVEMRQLGLNVPPAFIISTEACKLFYEMNGKLPKLFFKQVMDAMRWLEVQSGRTFAPTNGKAPLLVSVRSGARVSMPGMMDTILNLGLRLSGSADKPFSTLEAVLYNKFEKMFQEVVFEDNEKLIAKHWTTNPKDQLKLAIAAIFKSWNNPRAIHYRKMHDIPDGWGTAVVVQQMVLGCASAQSAIGVCFTRNPLNGKNELFGEFLVNAQGEDLVDGSHTPQPIQALEQAMPAQWKQLNSIAVQLEKHYKDVQDFEWTIQDGELFMLQTRSGKRETAAAIKIAIDMCEEGHLSPREAILRVAGLNHRVVVQKEVQKSAEALFKGIGAASGVIAGQVALSSAAAVKMVEQGLKVVLVKEETNPNDIKGMEVAVGMLTFAGGSTSHAAVVARGMNKVAVVGCDAAKAHAWKEGMWITLNGTTGEVFDGNVIAA